MRGLVLPMALIVAVLGSIFFGIATATEAAGVGAAGALVCAAVKRTLNWQDIKKACIETGKTTAMIVWIMIGAYLFKSVFVYSGGPQFVTEWVGSLIIAPILVVGMTQIAFIILGCFLADIVSMLIGLPVFLPIVDALGLSRLWFGVLLVVNQQIAHLTPPYGCALFFLKSVTPPGVTMGDIILSSIPFIALTLVGVALVMFFPQLALWLPSLMIT